ncbi:sensor histidine kinase [Chromobacterium amazonense]|nr:HAMP domain-containing sensor histidine kinase [Chromobacterium amazonense]
MNPRFKRLEIFLILIIAAMAIGFVVSYTSAAYNRVRFAYESLKPQLINYSAIDALSISYERYALSVLYPIKISQNDMEEISIKKSIFESKIEYLKSDVPFTSLFRQNEEYHKILIEISKLNKNIGNMISIKSNKEVSRVDIANKLDEMRDLINELQEVTYKDQVKEFSGLLYVLDVNSKDILFYSTSCILILFLLCIVLSFNLNKTRRLLTDYKKAIAEKNIFISTIRHEMASPIQTISYGLNYAQLKITDDSLIDLFVEMDQAIEKVELQIKEIADYSRLELGIVKIAYENFDLSELINEIVYKYRDKYKGKIVFVKSKNKFIMLSDRLKIYKALDNLISNSCKFNNGGTVYVNYRIKKIRKEETLIIRVRDKGIGIANADIIKIFDPFYQVDTKQNRVGMGLGLSIVKHTVDILGGQVSVKSILGKGSVFTIKLKVR